MQFAETVEQADTEAHLDHAEEQAAAAFADTTRTVEAVEHAEQVEARVATVEDAEALYATQLITEADANAGTWRGEWIGEHTDDGLFELPADQGALFTSTAEPLVVRMSQDPDTLTRIKAKATADREAYRAETDDRIATEHHAYGAPVPAAVQARIDARTTAPAPARRVIEGVIVSHNGTTPGTAPKHSTDEDARAAVAALAPLRLAEVTDHTDVTANPGDPDHTPSAWGFLVDPRGHGRVAVYWIEAGRYVRPSGQPFAVELEIGADKLRKAGWTIEPHTHRCVMAHRPA